MNPSEQSAKILTDVFLKHAASLPYAKINQQGEYLGWVTDFSAVDKNGSPFRLNLKYNQDAGFESIDDLFLLFVLASVWSRTGQWENAAYFILYLKISCKSSSFYWLDINNVNTEKTTESKNKVELVERNAVIGFSAGVKVSFRKDIYQSVYILAKEWNEIFNRLMCSCKNGDFRGFTEYLREIKGLGRGDNKMAIKIPLILRELRCQNSESHSLSIPGELCCVPDQRVVKAVKRMNENGLKFPNIPTPYGPVDNLIKSSALIYKHFGNLYDLPLFAYEDLMSAGHI